MSTETPPPSPPQATTTDPSRKPSASERFAWMAKNSRMLLIALVVIIVAVVVAAFSFSIFTSSSANPGNLVAAGVMSMENSKDGAAILTAEKILPGESKDGTVAITNVGDAKGAFTLTASNLVNTPPTPAFSEVLTLRITEGSKVWYDGKLSNISSIDLGTWNAGDKHTFTFTVTFAAASGNEYQDAKSTLDFTWNATQA